MKPANIVVKRSDNRAILLDFGLSKQYTAEGHETSTTPIGLSRGYAPIEQYGEGVMKTFSPSSDLYALAATLYYTISGTVPPQASELLNSELQFPAGIPTELKESIKKAMSPAVYDRHHSVAAFIREINDNIIPVNDLEHHHVSTLDELLGGDRGWNYSKSPPPKKKLEKIDIMVLSIHIIGIVTIIIGLMIGSR